MLELILFEFPLLDGMDGMEVVLKQTDGNERVHEAEFVERWSINRRIFRVGFD